MPDEPKFYYEEPESEDYEDKELIRKATILLQEVVPALLEVYNHLKDMSCRTPEEDQQLADIEEKLAQAYPYIDYMKNYFGDIVYKQAIAIYYHIKMKADEGNVEAQKAIKELKPLFEETLRNQIENN